MRTAETEAQKFARWDRENANITKAETWPLTIDKQDLEIVLKRALRTRNRFRGELASYVKDVSGDPITLDAPLDVLVRVARNFIRHVLTPYDSILEEIQDWDGAQTMHGVIKDRVEVLIDATYPDLIAAIAAIKAHAEAARPRH